MTVIENILCSLELENKTMHEIYREIGGKENTVKSELYRMKRYNMVVQNNDDRYTLTKTGIGELLKIKRESIPQYPRGNRAASKSELYECLPDREVFTINDVFDIIGAEKEEPLVSQVKYTINGLLREHKVVRVSPDDQPRNKLVEYIKGMDEGEWYCTSCHAILQANEFDAMNWGVSGSVCIHCQNDGKTVVLNHVEQEPVMADSVAIANNQFALAQAISHQIEEINKAVVCSNSRSALLATRLDTIEQNLKRLVDIQQDTYTLFQGIMKKSQSYAKV